MPKIAKDELKTLVRDEVARRQSAGESLHPHHVKAAITRALARQGKNTKQRSLRVLVRDAVREVQRTRRFVSRVRYVRHTPRKMRLVTDLIRGKEVNTADTILKTSSRRGAYLQRKLLQSAISNATYIARENNVDLDANRLTIVEAQVNPGPILKRGRHSSQRRPTLIRKRMSHALMVLEEREPPLSKKEKARLKQERREKGKQAPAPPAVSPPRPPPAAVPEEAKPTERSAPAGSGG